VPTLRRPDPRESPKGPKARRRAQRGAAYAETVVMLPFFVAVWTCIIYRPQGLDSTKLYTMQQNRHCVVSYAFEACQRPLPGCSQLASAPTPHRRGRAPRRPQLAPDPCSAAHWQLACFGALMGQTTELRTTRNVSKPGLLGGGNTQVLAGNSMMCNTQVQTPGSIVRNAFCSFIGIC
jgi:hypothetical protein